MLSSNHQASMVFSNNTDPSDGRSSVTSSATLQSSLYNSTMKETEEKLFMWIWSLVPFQRIPVWISYVSLLYHLYCSFSLGFDGSFNFGVYGQWIANILIIPRTFGSLWFPHAMQMAIAGLLFAFLLLTWFCVIVAMTIRHEDKKQHWDKLKIIVTLSCGLFGIFHLLFLQWVLPFVSCTFNGSNLLNQFPSVKCWSMQNVAHLILSSAFIVLQIPLSLLGIIITTTIAFDWRKSWRNIIS